MTTFEQLVGTDPFTFTIAYIVWGTVGVILFIGFLWLSLKGLELGLEFYDNLKAIFAKKETS